MYENRPIHWPLSSANRDLRRVGQHPPLGRRHAARPARRPPASDADAHRRRARDLRAARDGADKKAARRPRSAYDTFQKAREELRSSSPASNSAPRRARRRRPEVPARERRPLRPDLDDGVMINSPRCGRCSSRSGRTRRSGGRSWPPPRARRTTTGRTWRCATGPRASTRSARADPSLGVAHGCFWRYHPSARGPGSCACRTRSGPTSALRRRPTRGPDRGHDGDTARAFGLRDHPTTRWRSSRRRPLRRAASKSAGSVSELRLLETGALERAPGRVLGARAADHQAIREAGRRARVLAPDEPEARAAYEAAHPGWWRIAPSCWQGLRPPDRLRVRRGRGRGRRPVRRGRGRHRRRGGRRGSSRAMARCAGPGLGGAREDLRACVQRGGRGGLARPDDHYTGFVDRLIAAPRGG
jgi:hypothetical protein